MDSARNHENPNEGHTFVPKLILAGRLTSTLNGRPVVISAEEGNVSIFVAGFRSAWSIWKIRRAFTPMFRALHGSGIRIDLRVGSVMPSLELLPRPHFLVGLLAPELNRDLRGTVY